MKKTSTYSGVTFKKYLVSILTILSLAFSQFVYAHNVDSYSASCAAGPQYKVTAVVSNVNNTSNYRWQWKNSSNVWVCFVNGNNTINGNTYNVSGAVYNLTTTPGPIIFTNPNSGLQGLQIRMVISDGNGVNPCTLPNGNTWTSDNPFVMNVNSTPCGANGSIGDRVWLDANMNGLQDAAETGGISGVTVQLRNSANTVIATQTTNGTGNYLFTGLAAGTYTVAFPLSVSIGVLTIANVGSNDNIDSDPSQTTGITANIVLTANQSNITVDAGYKPTNLQLGNRVWYDTDNDGINDASENGIRNVTVKLYQDANNDNVADGAAIATLLTDANGNYTFTNLSPGNYIVGAVIPNGYMSSAVNGGDPDNNTDLDDNGQVVAGTEIRGLAITLTSGGEPTNGNTNNTYDFGFLPDCNCTTSAGNLLVNGSFENGTTGWSWSSANGSLTTGTGYIACGAANGFNNQSSGTSKVWQDVAVVAGSTVTFKGFAGTHTAGIACSPTLSLIFLNAANTVLGQSNVVVTRDVDINNSQLEQYSINAVAPAGATKVRVQSSITCNTMKMDAFCLTVIVPANLNLGNFVWYDANNNGVQDASEPGIGAATVKLYADANSDNVPDGAAIATTTTNATGAYGFGSLAAGNYIVGVTIPAGYAAAATTATSASPNNDNNTDNNGVTIVSGELRSHFITLSAGGEPTTDGDGNNGNLTLDFGLKGTASIGDYVWEDLNRDGLQDASEPPIAGVTVTLTTPTGTLTATTNASGNYNFTNLAPGTYSVAFSTPATYLTTQANAGSNDAIDSDPVGGVVSNIALAAGQVNNTVDAGFYRLINISGHVWNDANGLTDLQINKTGVQAIPNSLNVYLVDIATNLVIQREFILADGSYSFLDVNVNHSYKIVLSASSVFPGQPSPTASLPSGWSRVGENLGAGPLSGSDGVPNGLLFIDTETSDVFEANFGIRVSSGEVIVG